MRKIFFLSLMMLSSTHSYAEDMRIYGFTSSFVDCVKSYNSEKDEYSRAGNSESGLMNGRSKLAGAPLDSSYWSYMSCLENSQSGTVNSSLDIGKTCDKVELNTSYGDFYIPPGVDGKKVGVLGYYWECSNGSWSKIDGEVINPDGENIEAPPVQNQRCDEQEFNISSCKFNVSSKKHGQTAEDAYGPLWGDLTASSEGRILTSCNNGSYEVISSTCNPVNCQAGETVSWSGTNAVGVGSYCSGKVNEDGSVFHEAAPRVYFASENLAKIGTRIISGESKFVCHEGEWVSLVGNDSSCSVKTIEELNCQSVSINDDENREYYCE